MSVVQRLTFDDLVSNNMWPHRNDHDKMYSNINTIESGFEHVGTTYFIVLVKNNNNIEI